MNREALRKLAYTLKSCPRDTQLQGLPIDHPKLRFYTLTQFNKWLKTAGADMKEHDFYDYDSIVPVIESKDLTNCISTPSTTAPVESKAPTRILSDNAIIPTSPTTNTKRMRPDPNKNGRTAVTDNLVLIAG
ncbi:hypothetical protein AZE42_13164 [Rhizopogon vesiculosus]|uniref:Uncharacterized protein n=1 Tax=Rhizopogon vesiculosus TaxID=180088 RepID=A0A1J8QBP5_9AGAM|nr:hypothetical protein AZE42_13164 [Rhizopogon vesiculosus]